MDTLRVMKIVTQILLIISQDKCIIFYSGL